MNVKLGHPSRLNQSMNKRTIIEKPKRKAFTIRKPGKVPKLYTTATVSAPATLWDAPKIRMESRCRSTPRLTFSNQRNTQQYKIATKKRHSIYNMSYTSIDFLVFSCKCPLLSSRFQLSFSQLKWELPAQRQSRRVFLLQRAPKDVDLIPEI